MLLIIDALGAYRLADLGWPKYMKVSEDAAAGVAIVKIARAPFGWESWVSVIALAVVHLLIIYTFWKSRYRKAR